MSNILNWEQLYTQGRCKDIGVPWSEEELQKIKEGVSVDELRGIDIEKIEENLEKVAEKVEAEKVAEVEGSTEENRELEEELRKLNRSELVSYASKKGIDNPIRKTSDVLVEMIKGLNKNQDKKDEDKRDNE